MLAVRTISFGQAAVTKKNGTNGEHCVDEEGGADRPNGISGSRGKRSDENNLFVDSERKKNCNNVSDV